MITNINYIQKSAYFLSEAYKIVDHSFIYYTDGILTEKEHNENVILAYEIASKSHYYYLLGNPEKDIKKQITLFI